MSGAAGRLGNVADGAHRPLDVRVGIGREEARLHLKTFFEYARFTSFTNCSLIFRERACSTSTLYLGHLGGDDVRAQVLHDNAVRRVLRLHRAREEAHVHLCACPELP